MVLLNWGGKIEEWSNMLEDGGRTGDLVAAAVRQRGRRRAMSLSAGGSGHHRPALPHQQSKVSEMKNDSFSGLSLMERLLRSVLPPLAVLMSLVLVAARGHADIHGLCCVWRPC